MVVSPLAPRNKQVYNMNEKRPRAAFNCLKFVAPSSTHENQAYLNKLTTKKQINVNANLMGPCWRKKLIEVKIIFFQVCVTFTPC